MKKTNAMTDQGILQAINGAVKQTGYPIVGAVFKTIGVDRTKIRQLERKGLLKSVGLSVKGQYVKGYFTQDVYPSVLAEHAKALAQKAVEALKHEAVPQY